MMETARRHEDHEHKGTSPTVGGHESGGRGDAGGDSFKDASFSPEMRQIADQHLESQAAAEHAGSKPENPSAELKPEPQHVKE